MGRTHAAGGIRLPYQGTPDTPDSGSLVLYSKSGGKLFTVDDAGTEREVGGGGGLPYTPGTDLLEGVTASDWTFVGSSGSATVLGPGIYSLTFAGPGYAQLDLDVPYESAVRYWIWGGSAVAELRFSGGTGYPIDIEGGYGTIPPQYSHTLGLRIYSLTNSTVDLQCGFFAFSVVDNYEVQFWELNAFGFSTRSVTLESRSTVPRPVANQTVYYSKIEDGISSLWSHSPSGVVKEVGTPVGVVNDWAGLESKVPEGWMLCDGRSLPKADYPLLYERIGDTYGSTSTTFNIPDHRGRVSVAPDNMGGIPVGRIIDTTLGGSGGEEMVTLTTAQLPSHTHSNGSLTAASAGGHSHQTDTGNSFVVRIATGGTWNLPAGSGNARDRAVTNTAGAHTHNVTGSTSAAGGGNAHNNMQPYIIQNKIIKVLPG